MRVDLSTAASRNTADITIVIPCHNYARYLDELLQSIAASSVVPAKVIVIDDSSDDCPEPIVRRHGAEFHRVEFRHQADACRHGFQFVETKYVAFVDADDKVDREYLRTAIEQLEADRSVAFVYPWLEGFDLASGPRHGTEKSPDRIRWQDIEVRNWCPAGSVFRSEVLRQSLTMTRARDVKCVCNDWRTARDVLRAGPWTAVKARRPLHYRIHPGQEHSSRPGTYAQQADLQNEVVTIVVAFSGRWSAWVPLRDWIVKQEWPRTQTRLMILNSTHRDVTAAELGLAEWSGASLQIERMDAGSPGLADINRKTASTSLTKSIEAAVGGLYNAAVQMARGEWVLFLEDDTIPKRLDVVRRLFKSVQPRVAGVTGCYRHRYHPDKAVAFRLDGHVAALRPLAGSQVESVDGSGFGCLLARRSVLLQFPLAGDSVRKFYDVDVASRIRAAGWQWILDRGVTCDHLIDCA